MVEIDILAIAREVARYIDNDTSIDIAKVDRTGDTMTGGLTITTTSAALIIPRMTAAQRDALTPVPGMLIYNTDTNKLNFRAAAAWEAVTSV